MKTLLLALTSFSLITAPLAYATNAPIAEPVPTNAERFQRLMKAIPLAELRAMAEQEKKSIELFRKAVLETQIALANKKAVRDFYLVNLNVNTTARIVTVIAAMTALPGSAVYGLNTIASDYWRRTVINNIKNKSFFQIRQGIADDMIHVKEYQYFKNHHPLYRIFKYATLTAIASGLIVMNSLSESSVLNEEEIKQLESSLSKISADLDSHERFNTFLLSQLEIREKAQ